MREPKVRAWDTQAHVWVEGIELVIHTSGRLLRIPAHIILTWSIGLADETGKEVYEGDVVVWGPTTPPQVVEWDEAICGFQPYCDYDVDCDGLPTIEEQRKWKVIGNIYEQPELLQHKAKV